MEADCIIIELKPNSIDRVMAWADFINKNKADALKTLEREEVVLESFFIINIANEDYLIGYMRAKDIEKAKAVVKKSIHKIDKYHQKFKEDTWLKVSQAELLVDLSRLNNK